MRKRKEDKDAIDAFQEWQDHRYDPGYWVGGRIPPFLQGNDPNKAKYSFLVAFILGAFSLSYIVYLIRSWLQLSDIGVIGYVIELAFTIGAATLYLVVGIKLLRNSSKGRGHGKRPKI